MSMFKHEARQWKFDVLRELASMAFKDQLNEDRVNELPRKLIPSTRADSRCCVYKEREILRKRARLTLGKMADDFAEYAFFHKWHGFTSLDCLVDDEN